MSLANGRFTSDGANCWHAVSRSPSAPARSRSWQVLVQSANELVTKDALMDRIWPGAIVGENTLHVHISAIRKALDQDRAMLTTVSGRGYRLLGDWTVRRESAAEETVGLLRPVRLSRRTFQTNLPETALDLIGRTIAMRQIQDILSSYRAITLTGPGGIGKTTLALHISRHIRRTFDGEIWLIELASLSDRNLVPSAVADVLGLNLGGDEITAEAVASAIGDKPLLLVLDNCEHVIDATARLGGNRPPSLSAHERAGDQPGTASNCR